MVDPEPGTGTDQWGPWEEVGDADGSNGDSGNGDTGGNDGNGGNDDGSGTGDAGAWDPDQIYTDGDRVTHNGTTWEAQWWTQDQEPGASQWGPWEAV